MGGGRAIVHTRANQADAGAVFSRCTKPRLCRPRSARPSGRSGTSDRLARVLAVVTTLPPSSIVLPTRPSSGHGLESASRRPSARPSHHHHSNPCRLTTSGPAATESLRIETRFVQNRLFGVHQQSIPTSRPRIWPQHLVSRASVQRHLPHELLAWNPATATSISPPFVAAAVLNQKVVARLAIKVCRPVRITTASPLARFELRRPALAT